MKVINRLKASDDFALAIKKGKAQRNQSFVIHYRSNDMLHTRIGISVSVKLGNAVTRNHIKRQIRTMCDLLFDYQDQPLDIVVIAKPGFLNHTFDDNKQALAHLLVFR